MQKWQYRSALLALAFGLLLIDDGLMVFEIRSNFHIEPIAAVIIGSLSSLVATIMITMAVINGKQ